MIPPIEALLLGLAVIGVQAPPRQAEPATESRLGPPPCGAAPEAARQGTGGAARAEGAASAHVLDVRAVRPPAGCRPPRDGASRRGPRRSTEPASEVRRLAVSLSARALVAEPAPVEVVLVDVRGRRFPAEGSPLLLSPRRTHHRVVVDVPRHAAVTAAWIGDACVAVEHAGPHLDLKQREAFR